MAPWSNRSCASDWPDGAWTRFQRFGAEEVHAPFLQHLRVWRLFQSPGEAAPGRGLTEGVLKLFDCLSGYFQGFQGGGKATINGDLHDRLSDFLLGGSGLEGIDDMTPELGRSVEHREGGDGTELARFPGYHAS